MFHTLNFIFWDSSTVVVQLRETKVTKINPSPLHQPEMMALIEFIITAIIITACGITLYRMWLWAIENFNLGHIQLQDLNRRQYETIPEDEEEETQTA